MQTFRMYGETYNIDLNACIYDPAGSKCPSCVFAGRLPCTARPRPSVNYAGTSLIDGEVMRQCESSINLSECHGMFVPVGRQKYCDACRDKEKAMRWTRGWRASKLR